MSWFKGESAASESLARSKHIPCVNREPYVEIPPASGVPVPADSPGKSPRMAMCRMSALTLETWLPELGEEDNLYDNLYAP
jgi:hypothetical protein